METNSAKLKDKIYIMNIAVSNVVFLKLLTNKF
jgi:hypothetical protein